MAFLDNQGVSKLCALLKDKFDNVMSAVNRKQDALTAGANITINNGVISAADTNTTYTAGTGINIDANNEISCTVSGGSSYTAGDGINIDENGVISADANPLVYSMLQMTTARNDMPLVVKLDNSSTWEQFVDNVKAGKVVYISTPTSYTFSESYKLTPALLDISTLYALNLASMSVPMMSPSVASYPATGIQVYYQTYYYFDGAFLWSWNNPEDLGNFIKVRFKTYKNYALGRALSDINTDISAKLTTPTNPSTDGTYKLTSTISSGTPTYTWTADSGSSGGGSTETIYPGNINSVPYGLFWDGGNIPAFQEGPAQNQENLPYFKIQDMNQLNEGFAALRDGNLVQFYQPTAINLQDYVEQIFGPQADVPTWNSCLMMWFQSVDGVMQFDINKAQIYDSQTNTINRTVGGGTFAIKIGRIVYVFMNTRRAAALEWLRNFYNIPILSSNSTSLPAAPSADGNYILKCSVSSGTPTYSWESVTVGGSY